MSVVYTCCVLYAFVRSLRYIYTLSFFFFFFFLSVFLFFFFFFFFQAEDGIRDLTVTGVQTCALPILAFLGLAALSSFLPGGGGQGGGSPSSSYTNRPDGTAAWAELLSRFGHRVDRLRGDLDPGMLDPGATVVVLDAPGLTGQEAHDLGRFVRLGGHLVAGGVGSGDWLRSVIGNPPTLADDGPRTAGPVGAPPAPEID